MIYHTRLLSYKTITNDNRYLLLSEMASEMVLHVPLRAERLTTFLGTHEGPFIVVNPHVNA